MPKVTYSIDQKNKDKEGFIPIKANVCINYKTTSKIVGKIDPVNWDKGVIVPNDKRNKKYKELKELKEELEKLQFNSRDYFSKLEKEGVEITLQLAKDYLNGKEYFKAEKINFWEAYEEFIKVGKITTAKNTIKSRNTTYNKLKEFEKSSGHKLTFKSINHGFFDQLNEFILVDQGNQWNDFSATVKRFKTFMNWSLERGYHDNLTFKKFSAPEKEPTIIKLTQEELETLLNFPFEKEHYKKSRDFFCFGCFTGLRYSDLNKLTKDNIVTEGNKKTLRVTIEKTKIEVNIPMIPAIEMIINRYKDQYKLLPAYENAAINRNLKEICEEAKINTPTEIKVYNKKGTELKFLPKFKLIGTHTGRKTFINLAHKLGMDLEEIKKITGIQQEKTLKRYLDIDQETLDDKMKKAFNCF